MRLQIADWAFDIDLDCTMEYSASEAEDHCTCAYCRNFYASVDASYPDLRPFLAQFGIDIEAPDEQMPYDIQGKMYYDSTYMVCGRIVKTGAAPIWVDGISVQPVSGSDSSAVIPVNHSCPEPRFALEVPAVVVPWVLDEPMEETISPANEPSFLKKMWDRLLEKVSKNGMNS